MKLSDKCKNFLLVALLLVTSFSVGRSYGINTTMDVYDPVINSSRETIDKLRAQMKDAKYSDEDVKTVVAFCLQNQIEDVKITKDGITFVLVDGSIWMNDGTGLHDITGTHEEKPIIGAYSA